MQKSSFNILGFKDYKMSGGLQLSYKVKRIFIKNDNDIYTELSYQEWIHSTENRNLLRNRKFIAAGDDALMEVSETEYRDFARLERHLRYLNYLDSIHHLERYGAIITDMNAQEINVQDADDVSEEAEKKILLKKLRICLSKLSAEQQELVQDIFFKFLTEQEVAQKLGISQSAVSQRKNTVLRKLRNLIECSED